jgi:hypothetical protein
MKRRLVMKTGKYLVYLSLLALGLTAGVAPVYAESSNVSPTPPGLENDERGLFCLIESALSLLAARVADVGCDEAEGTYPLSVFVNDNGNTLDCDGDSCFPTEEKGGAVLDKNLTLDNLLLVVDEERGAKCTLSLREGMGTLLGTKEDGEGTPQATVTTVVEQYTGQHAWKGDNTIFIDSADFTLRRRSEVEGTTTDTDSLNFGERSIKNFFKTRKGKIRDDGLEAITQDGITQDGFPGFPQEKWRERSKYIPPSGEKGTLNIEKERIAPSGCLIRLNMEVEDTDSSAGVGCCRVCLPGRPRRARPPCPSCP